MIYWTLIRLWESNSVYPLTVITNTVLWEAYVTPEEHLANLSHNTTCWDFHLCAQCDKLGPLRGRLWVECLDVTEVVVIFTVWCCEICVRLPYEDFSYDSTFKICNASINRFVLVLSTCHHFAAGGLLLYFQLVVVVTSVHWSLHVTRSANSHYPPPSTYRPLTLTPSSALPRAWERNSGNIFHVKCRGPVEGCDASALFQRQKRNRLWWGQFLLVPKKQALSHTDFLPHWTAQNNHRPTNLQSEKERKRRKKRVGDSQRRE